MVSPDESQLSRAARYAIPFGLLLIPVWMIRVNAVVPEPYLDEVFHVPQAQAYWAHKWSQWDPKLTTPPGLYLWSYALCAALLLLRGTPTKLTTEVLRMTNVATTAIFLPWRLQTLLDTIQKVTNDRKLSSYLGHTALNICLFPPLFFFSGLYYTDILALLVVVEAYNWDLKRASAGGSGVLQTLGFLAFGLAALVCRQTNIFWVSVFLGGLQVVRKVRTSSSTCSSSKVSKIVKQGLQQNELYDPLVSEATLADYFKTIVSFAAVALKKPSAVLVSILPHLVVLAAFGGFVIWNNGVVLGHKEFHTAGIHLAQMLYIWPYFAFFSWPLFVIPVINILTPKKSIPESLDLGWPAKQRKLPSLKAVLAVIPLMLAVVHFNTIVHPFTLADNRHYVFYIFRLLLGIHPAVKYAAVLVYFLSGWAVISAFGFSTLIVAPKLMRVPEKPAATAPAPPAPIPAPAPAPTPAPATKPTQPSQPPKGTKRITRPNRKNTMKPKQPEEQPKTKTIDPNDPAVIAKVQQSILARQKTQLEAPRVSFVLIWLAATTLSLVTAPLVEPRYFIIPWVMWRLHLPPLPGLLKYRVTRPRKEEDKRRADFVVNSPKFLETVWFLLINLVTGYVFLYKGFEWPQEPGKIQRFMW